MRNTEERSEGGSQTICTESILATAGRRRRCVDIYTLEVYTRRGCGVTTSTPRVELEWSSIDTVSASTSSQKYAMFREKYPKLLECCPLRHRPYGGPEARLCGSHFVYSWGYAPAMPEVRSPNPSSNDPGTAMLENRQWTDRHHGWKMTAYGADVRSLAQ